MPADEPNFGERGAPYPHPPRGDGKVPSQTPEPKVRFAPREIAAGLFLIALAAVGLVGGWTLNFGKLSGIGPGLMPKVTAAIVAAFGLLLVLGGLFGLGERLERWSLRGLFFVLGAVVLFGLTVRSLGLAVAGPLAVMISAFADPETGIWEILIFAIVITALCVGMFKFVLRLPIPILPMVLGY